MSDPRRRVLMLAPFAPSTSGIHGGSRAIAALLTDLAIDHDIALLYLRGRDEPDTDDEVRNGCALVCEVARPWSYARSRPLKAFRLGTGLLSDTPMWVRRWRATEFAAHVAHTVTTWRPDLVQFDFHVMAQYANSQELSMLPKILVQHESGTAAAAERMRRARGSARPLAFADHRAWSRYERRTMAIFDRVVTFTARDADAVRSISVGARLATIPIGVRVPPAPLSALGSDARIVFIGSFLHYPNEDAAVRLATRILPLVHLWIPSATLDIVGSAVPTQIAALAGPRVRVHESVPDVTPYLNDAAVVAAPIRLGSGMRVKVLDALAAGKSMVCSQLAADGLGLQDGVEVMLADSDVEFASAIVELLGSPDRRCELAVRARKWALEHATSRRAADEFRSLYESVMRERTALASVQDPTGIALPVT